MAAKNHYFNNVVMFPLTALDTTSAIELDVFLLEDRPGQSFGRPTATFSVWPNTRTVLGFHISQKTSSYFVSSVLQKAPPVHKATGFAAVDAASMPTITDSGGCFHFEAPTFRAAAGGLGMAAAGPADDESAKHSIRNPHRRQMCPTLSACSPSPRRSRRGATGAPARCTSLLRSPRVAVRLYCATGGHVGLVAKYLSEAFRRALADKLQTVDPKLFAQVRADLENLGKSTKLSDNWVAPTLAKREELTPAFDSVPRRKRSISKPWITLKEVRKETSKAAARRSSRRTRD